MKTAALSVSLLIFYAGLQNGRATDHGVEGSEGRAAETGQEHGEHYYDQKQAHDSKGAIEDYGGAGDIKLNPKQSKNWGEGNFYFSKGDGKYNYDNYHDDHGGKKYYVDKGHAVKYKEDGDFKGNGEYKNKENWKESHSYGEGKTYGGYGLDNYGHGRGDYGHGRGGHGRGRGGHGRGRGGHYNPYPSEGNIISRHGVDVGGETATQDSPGVIASRITLDGNTGIRGGGYNVGSSGGYIEPRRSSSYGSKSGHVSDYISNDRPDIYRLGSADASSRGYVDQIKRAHGYSLGSSRDVGSTRYGGTAEKGISKAYSGHQGSDAYGEASGNDESPSAGSYAGPSSDRHSVPVSGSSDYGSSSTYSSIPVRYNVQDAGDYGDSNSHGNNFAGYASPYNIVSGSSSAGSNRPISRDYDTSSSGGYNIPDSGGYDGSSSGGYSGPYPGGYGGPPSESYDDSHVNGYNRPRSGGDSGPNSGSDGSHTSANYGEPTSSSYDGPGSGGYTDPIFGRYNGRNSGTYYEHPNKQGSLSPAYDSNSRERQPSQGYHSSSHSGPSDISYGSYSGEYGDATKDSSSSLNKYRSDPGRYGGDAGNYGAAKSDEYLSSRYSNRPSNNGYKREGESSRYDGSVDSQRSSSGPYEETDNDDYNSRYASHGLANDNSYRDVTHRYPSDHDSPSTYTRPGNIYYGSPTRGKTRDSSSSYAVGSDDGGYSSRDDSTYKNQRSVGSSYGSVDKTKYSDYDNRHNSYSSDRDYNSNRDSSSNDKRPDSEHNSYDADSSQRGYGGNNDRRYSNDYSHISRHSNFQDTPRSDGHGSAYPLGAHSEYDGRSGRHYRAINAPGGDLFGNDPFFKDFNPSGSQNSDSDHREYVKSQAENAEAGKRGYDAGGGKQVSYDDQQSSNPRHNSGYRSLPATLEANAKQEKNIGMQTENSSIKRHSLDDYDLFGDDDFFKDDYRDKQENGHDSDTYSSGNTYAANQPVALNAAFAGPKPGTIISQTAKTSISVGGDDEDDAATDYTGREVDNDGRIYISADEKSPRGYYDEDIRSPIYKTSTSAYLEIDPIYSVPQTRNYNTGNSSGGKSQRQHGGSPSQYANRNGDHSVPNWSLKI